MSTKKPDAGMVFRPASKKQEMFINSDAFLTVYGKNICRLSE